MSSPSTDRGTTVYYRDQRGNVTQRIDGRGITTNYTYDNAGRPLTVSYFGYANDNVTFTWDEAADGSYSIGRLTTIADGSGTTKRRYDSKGRVWGEWRSVGSSPALYTWWGRDASGNITEAFYPSGRHIVWSRDAQGRVVHVAMQKTSSDPWVDVANPVTWNPYGPVSSLTFGNGVSATFGVDTD